jgi:hypothetical protein
VDQGCECYAAVSERITRRLDLPLFPIEPRRLKEATSSEKLISSITCLEADLDGYRHRVWAYVIPNLRYEVILGKPWMEDQLVEYTAHKRRLKIGRAGGMVVKEKTKQSNPRSIRGVGAMVFGAELRRGRRSGAAKTQVFAASLDDITKALAPKRSSNILERLPPQYTAWKHLFKEEEGDKLPPHRDGGDHEIELVAGPDGREPQVPWGPLYGMSREELLVLRKTLTELLDKGYIRASSSPAGAPVLFVKKPGGGLRFCVDYRALNAITRADRYPLPLIKETLANLSKARWFTKLDVRAAFYKLRIKEGDEWKTAFRTRFGLFEWLVTPFGLTGAPASFQRYINNTLREFLDVFCTAYIDDILIYTSGSRADHEAKTKQVLSALQAAGLHLDIDKCEFSVQTTKYLGYIIEAGKGLRMDPEKVRAIREWEAPSTLKGVRSFLGFANFYRQFIKDYSRIAAPLTALTKKGTPFRWGNSESEAFEQLKSLFISEPALAQWDPERRTTLEADCSGYSLGGCLSQEDEQGLLRPVAYYSRKLLPAECNYEIFDKELLAVVSCMEAWDGELRSVKDPFIVLSDHKNLQHFRTVRRLSERQVRWAEKLARYSFTLQYRKGAESERPDALSRREQDMPQNLKDPRLAGREMQLLKDSWLGLPTREPPDRTMVNTIEIRGVELPTGDEVFVHEDLIRAWEEGIERDATYSILVKAVLKGDRTFPPNVRIQDKKLAVSIAECAVGRDRILRYRGRKWIPEWEPLQTALIQNTHDSYLTGHPGREGTVATLGRDYFWPGMYKQVRRFLRNCDICRRKTVWRHHKKGFLKPLPVPDRFWSELSIDFMTHLPQEAPEDPSYLMVITDRLSKAVTLEAMSTMSAEACAERFVSAHWRFHGFPKAIVSDRGTNWVGGFWRRLCELTRVEQRLSTAFHPETDGATERMNQEVLAYLRAYVAYAQTDWVELLPGAMLAINNRDTSTIGLSPFFIQHGYHVTPIQEVEKSPIPSFSPRARAEAFVQRLKDATDFAQAAMAAAQQSMEESANTRRTPAESFKVGDMVWLSLKNIDTGQASKKLAWLHSKYRVTRVLDTHTVELDVPSGIHSRFHVDLLVRDTDDPLPSQVRLDPRPPPVIQDDSGEGEGTEEWLIDSILRARTKRLPGRGNRTRREVEVKWAGYQQPTWEPLENFVDTAALEAFENRYGDAHHHDGPTPLRTGADNAKRRSRYRA